MSSTKRRQEAVKRAAARTLNAVSKNAADVKLINGNTLKRVARELAIAESDSEQPARRLRSYAWLVSLEQRFARRVLEGREGRSQEVPAEIVIEVADDCYRPTVEAVSTLCSAHGYVNLKNRVWVMSSTKGATQCP